jgi:uncharacterized protein (TIGR03085 family)
MVTSATLERQNLADELLAVGPEAPTLCGTWTTRQLAGHLAVRDSRPDALPGLVIPQAAGYTDRLVAAAAAGDWNDLVERVRNGPPAWSPARIDAVDTLINTAEFFVHLEDIRRAQPEWKPRRLDTELVDQLYAGLKRSAKLLVRKSPVGITLMPDDGRPPIVARKREPMVTVSGHVGELVLWTFGRQAHSIVGYVGPDDAVQSVREASFGI